MSRSPQAPLPQSMPTTNRRSPHSATTSEASSSDRARHAMPWHNPNEGPDVHCYSAHLGLHVVKDVARLGNQFGASKWVCRPDCEARARISPGLSNVVTG